MDPERTVTWTRNRNKKNNPARTKRMGTSWSLKHQGCQTPWSLKHQEWWNWLIMTVIRIQMRMARQSRSNKNWINARMTCITESAPER